MKRLMVILILIFCLPLIANAQDLTEVSNNLALTLPVKDDLPANYPTSRVDEVLLKLSEKLEGPISDPIQDEQSFNRALNYTRQGGSLLKPVGYSEIKGKRVMYVATDTGQMSSEGQGKVGASLQRLEEGSSVGALKVDSVSMAGLEYTVGAKKIFAPLTLMVTEAPKAPTVVNSGGRMDTTSSSSQVAEK